MPAAVRPRAKSVSPVLSLTLMRARRIAGDGTAGVILLWAVESETTTLDYPQQRPGCNWPSWRDTVGDATLQILTRRPVSGSSTVVLLSS